MTIFAIGETVRLKSGGPIMTIIEKDNNPLQAKEKDYYFCQWFEGSDIKEATFPAAALEKVEAKQGPSIA